MSNIDLLKSSLSFWESISFWALIGLLVAPVGEFLLEFSSILKETPTKRWGKSFALILILAAAIEIGAHVRRAMLTHEIFAILQNETNDANVAAARANKRAGEANELAGIANKKAAEAYERAGRANEAAASAAERAGKLEIVAAELRAKNLEQEKALNFIRKDINARTISDEQNERFADFIEGKKHLVTLILPDDQEARTFGTLGVKAMLSNAGFTVKLSDLGGTSKYPGIIVCSNGGDGVKVFRALRRAKIEARLFDERMKDRPEFCNNGVFSVDVPSIRIFIGQRMTRMAQ